MRWPRLKLWRVNDNILRVLFTCCVRHQHDRHHRNCRHCHNRHWHTREAKNKSLKRSRRAPAGWPHVSTKGPHHARVQRFGRRVRLDSRSSAWTPSSCDSFCLHRRRSPGAHEAPFVLPYQGRRQAQVLDFVVLRCSSLDLLLIQYAASAKVKDWRARLRRILMTSTDVLGDRGYLCITKLLKFSQYERFPL